MLPMIATMFAMTMTYAPIPSKSRENWAAEEIPMKVISKASAFAIKANFTLKNAKTILTIQRISTKIPSPLM